MKLLNAFLLAVLLTLAAFAQTAKPKTGAIQGLIFDPRGYTIYGVSVIARNKATGEEQTAIANDKSEFAFDSLPPGNYLLIAEYEGVEKLLQSLTVEIGKTAQVELVGIEKRNTGNDSVDKMLASSTSAGG